MKRRVCIAFLVSAGLHAQSTLSNCVSTPPRAIDDHRDVLPGFLDFDPGKESQECIWVSRSRQPSVVSARGLAHQSPKAARKEFDLGVRDSRKGRIDGALKHLIEAVRLDPDLIEAHAQLGMVYARTGQPLLALDHFKRALALEPNSATLHSNAAAALIALHRGDEAERAARRAVQLAPGSAEANYVLGLALLQERKITPEVVTCLELASTKYPTARETLDLIRVYLARADQDR